jgi:hypothetical protein
MEESRPLPEGLPFGLNLLNGSPFPAYPFFAGFPNPQLFQQLIAGQTRVPFNESTPSTSGSTEPDPDPNILDLRKPGCSSSEDQQKNHRKGPVFKVGLSRATHRPPCFPTSKPWSDHKTKIKTRRLKLMRNPASLTRTIIRKILVIIAI